MGQAHPPAAMERGGKYPMKHTYSTGRRGNVWFDAFKCPVCGAHTSRPCNPFRGRNVPPPVCDGVTYHETTGRPMKRPARLPKQSD
jgi:hypothetical protein